MYRYFFICHKPPTASLLDLMGPWPWYLIPLSLVAVLMFLLFYSPYAIGDWLSSKRMGEGQGRAETSRDAGICTD